MRSNSLAIGSIVHHFFNEAAKHARAQLEAAETVKKQKESLSDSASTPSGATGLRGGEPESKVKVESDKARTYHTGNVVQRGAEITQATQESTTKAGARPPTSYHIQNSSTTLLF